MCASAGAGANARVGVLVPVDGACGRRWAAREEAEKAEEE